MDRFRRAAEAVGLVTRKTAWEAVEMRWEAFAGVVWSAGERRVDGGGAYALDGWRGSKLWRRSVAGRGLGKWTAGVGRMPSATRGGAELGVGVREVMEPRSSGPWLLLKTIL